MVLFTIFLYSTYFMHIHESNCCLSIGCRSFRPIYCLKMLISFFTVLNGKSHNIIATLHYSRFEVRLFIIRQSMNFGFWKFFGVQMWTFIWHIIYTFEKWKINLNFCWGIPLDPNLISKDQVGSGACPHIKIWGASRSMGGTGQKMSRKTDFQ